MALIDGTKLIVHANNSWVDSSDNPATADADGATFSSPGKLGSHEGSFDGINDNVDYGNPSKLDITATITVAAWVKRRASQTRRTIGWKANAYGICFSDPSTSAGPNQPAFSVYNGGWKVALSPDIIDDTDSHLIIGSFDGSTVRIFVDNIFKAQYSFSGAISSSTHKFSIGSYELDSSARGWFADILADEVVIWDRAISYGGVSIGESATGEVAELWNEEDGIEIGISAGIPVFRRRMEGY